MKFSFGNLFLRVPISEKILLAKHLSLMVKAGMPIVSSLRLVRKQITSRGFSKILDRVINDVENGQFLSVSFSQFKNVFGELFINIIKIGEMSGTLAENLDYLANELKKAQQLRSKTISALMYPIIILIATVGITGAIVFFVLPKILPIFSSLRVELPLSTKILIAVSHFLFNYYLWIIGGIVVLIVALILLMRIQITRYYVHRFLIFLPLVKKIVIGLNMTTFTRTCGLLLKSGTKIIEALTITSDVISNEVYKKELHAIALEVEKGGSLHSYFENRPSLFPPIITRMIEVGETTGKLDVNLFYLAEFYEEDVDEFLKNLSTILEPLLLVAMGLVVGFVAISIVTPIYNITQGLKAK